MPYQQPRSDHPWRQYANRRVMVTTTVEVEGIISVREFIEDLAANWDKIEIIYPHSFEGRNQFYLKELPQPKVAAYIAGMLKRYYNYVEARV